MKDARLKILEKNDTAFIKYDLLGVRYALMWLVCLIGFCFWATLASIYEIGMNKFSELYCMGVAIIFFVVYGTISIKNYLRDKNQFLNEVNGIK